MRRLIVAVLAATLLGGCTNSYSKFYVDETAGDGGHLDRTYQVQEPVLYSSSGDWGQDEVRMFEQGYSRIGSASFNGVLEGRDAVVKQARAVGAHAVVTSWEYTNTVNSVVPITTSQPVTSYHSGTVSGYGYGSLGSYSGSSTTYVPQTTFVPVTTEKYDQNAVFFAKMKPSCLGMLGVDLSVEERQRLGTNAGVKAASIRQNSPVYVADMLAGDILLSIDGRRVDMANFHSITVPSQQTISIEIERAGQRLNKTITTGECS